MRDNKKYSPHVPLSVTPSSLTEKLNHSTSRSRLEQEEPPLI